MQFESNENKAIFDFNDASSGKLINVRTFWLARAKSSLSLICQIKRFDVYSPISKAAIAGVLSIKQPLAMINAKRLRFQLPLPFQFLVGRTRLWSDIDDNDDGDVIVVDIERE